jgi:hypothetical protein
VAVITLDQACADAVELAQTAALRRCGVFGVGEHLGVEPEDQRVATHYFACTHPGYPGWRWSVTVARASRARVVTVSEVLMVPGEGALLSPSWVPWAERVTAKDIVPGAILPTRADDERLVPGYTGDETADLDPGEWSQVRWVVTELGLGRERVLSGEGRDSAANRWLAGTGGPDNEMTHQAPAMCASCGFMVPLAGSLGRLFGACTNEYSPQDGEVVSRDHGCGGHSDVAAPKRGVKLGIPIWDTISIDPTLFD